MASGLDHEKATRLWSLIFGLITTIFLGPKIGITGGLAFLLGGLWLSPDLDTQSKPLQRWGILKWLWWPYRKLIRHRSLFSHGPIIGTGLRLAYLFLLIELILLAIKFLGFNIEITTITILSNLLKQYPKYILIILISLEGSAWLHIMKDGDPVPLELKNWKHK